MLKETKMSNEEIRSRIEESLKKVALKLNIINHDIKIHVKDQTKDGFLGDFFFANITNQDTSEVTHLAIKRAFEKGVSSFMEMIVWAYDNEVQFYDEIMPAFNKLQKEAGVKDPFDNVAKCYFTQKDSTSKLLVFEDITKKGFQLFDMEKLFTSDHHELIFSKYAKYHALSFVLKKQNPAQFAKLNTGVYDGFPVFLTDSNLKNMMTQGCKDVVQCFDPVEDEEIYQQVKKYDTNALGLLKEVFDYNGGFWCWLHGDCWSNNMMFKYDANGKLEDMRILDFQLIKEGCPVHDLSYYFYTSSTSEDQNKFDHYLNLYHLEFSKFVLELGENPEEIYPIEALKRDWLAQSKYGLIMASILHKAKLTKKEEITNYYKDKEEADVPTEIIANAIYDKDEYKKRIRGLVKHLYAIKAL